jgi:hypothetical protein
VEADALYHELQFLPTVLNSQAPNIHTTIREHVVTWELPVLVNYRFRLPGTDTTKERVSPFIEAGPAFRISGNLNYASPSNHGFAAGLGVEARLWKLGIAPPFRYLRWAPDQTAHPFTPATVTDQVQFLTTITFP